MKDYYALLGVERNATKAEIKKNYRLLAVKFHPDKNSHPDAPAKFIAITEAYDTLSNKKSRAQYDLFRWEKLKRQKESAESFTVVPPQYESTRTRRNKAQRKRSNLYHQTNSKSKRSFMLAKEGLYIVSRYFLHLLGITLFIVILNSIISQIPGAFEEGLFAGMLLCILVGALGYTIYWIFNNFYMEFKKDIETFSIFYKLARSKAVILCLSTLGIILILYLAVLRLKFM